MSALPTLPLSAINPAHRAGPVVESFPLLYEASSDHGYAVQLLYYCPDAASATLLSAWLPQQSCPWGYQRMLIDLRHEWFVIQPTSSAAAKTSYAQDTLSNQLAHCLLEELKERERGNQDYVYRLGGTLVAQVLMSCQRQKDREQCVGLTPFQVQRVREFILSHLDQPIRITELARCVRLSRFHFARRFKQTAGQSPGQFTVHLKMQKAKELLLTTLSSVIQVGLEVGYDNPSHFSTTFKKVMGISPTRLRKTLRKP